MCKAFIVCTGDPRISWFLLQEVQRLWIQGTLFFYKSEYQKQGQLLILFSRLARYSWEPKLKRIFEILWVLFEKISVFYNDWPKSLIWRTLRHVTDIVFNCDIHNTSKRSLSSKKCHFARIEKLPKCQFWTLAWNSKNFSAKRILLKHYEDDNCKKYP